ncbi:hypothetical protein D3C72_1839900 [compost metagenome]
MPVEHTHAARLGDLRPQGFQRALRVPPEGQRGQVGHAEGKDLRGQAKTPRFGFRRIAQLAQREQNPPHHGPRQASGCRDAGNGVRAAAPERVDNGQSAGKRAYEAIVVGSSHVCTRSDFRLTL